MNEPIHSSLVVRAADVSLASFMADHNVKLSWVAFFSLWILWGLLWLIRHIFGDGHQGADYSGGRGEVATTEPAAATHRPWIRHPLAVATHSRLSRAGDVLRDLVLMLFSMLSLNTLARGAQRHVMILCWVFFAFAVFWAIFEASYEHHMARLLYGIIFFGLSLAIGALAFRDGFQ